MDVSEAEFLINANSTVFGNNSLNLILVTALWTEVAPNEPTLTPNIFTEPL